MDDKRIHNLFEQEKTTKEQSVQAHPREIQLFADLLNVYINGFNQIGSFTPTAENETQWVWALLLHRSFHSFRCAIDLIQKAYYSEAMALLRRSTEDWFICGNCNIEPKINKAILDRAYRIPSRELPFKKMAIKMKAFKVYDQDYAFTSRFAHASNSSLAILLDRANTELSIAPHYEKVLFLACCEQLFRNGIRMGDYLLAFLNSISPEKAKSWWGESETKLLSISGWLEQLQELSKKKEL